GITYRVKGYVGYSAEDGLVVLPLAAVPGPRLLAPNPINPEAAPGEYIEMNVISESLNITLNLEGVDEDGDELQFAFGDTDKTNWEAWVNGIDWNDKSQVETIPANGSISVTYKELEDGGCTLAVRLVSNGLPSGIVTIRFNKKDATVVDNIADFKALFPDDKTLPALSSKIGDDHEYFRYSGLAHVRAVTPHYIYIRTTPGDGNTLPDTEDLSSHSILIYNADGWNQDVAGINYAATAAEGIEPLSDNLKPLEAGDVITNFALIPTRSKFGNLIANATGYIRTFRRVEDARHEPITPYTINAQNNEVKPFDDSDRMLLYSIKNVRVIREGDVNGNAEGDGSEIENLFTYYLDLPGRPVLNVKDIFEPVNGWDVIYSESALYNITGVVMLADGSKKIEDDGTYPDGRYMVAMMPDFTVSGVETPRAPRIELSGAGVDSEKGEFITTATVTLISQTAESQKIADIWYTTDGTDPRTSDTHKKYTKPFTISKNTVIKAYVLANGMPNSEVADTLFTKTGVETRYIINFLSQAQEGIPYHLTANVRVVAKGGEYFFVRGTQGHYLPVKIDDEAIDLNKINVDDYLNDMVITPHVIDEYSVIRGAHITPLYKDLFKFGSKDKPAELDEDITHEPDIVNTLTASHARRYVKLNGVSLTGFKVETAETEAQASDQWVLITEKGEGEQIKVNHNILKPSFDWDAADKTEAACYNVTGFAMIGDDGNIELWPTEVEKVTTTLPVRASFGDYFISNVGSTATLRTVRFNPYTTVTLTPTGASSATIYYYIADSSTDPVPPTSLWNVYAQPFTVAKNCFIHAKAVREGYEESVCTHLTMIRVEDDDNNNSPISGGLVFSHRYNEKGVPLVKIEPENKNLKPGTYDIFYTTDGSTPTLSSKKYTAEFEFPGGGSIFAILKEASKALPGKVANYNVWYVPTGIDGIDSDRTDNDAVRTEGNTIIAPEGSEIYDINGRRVNATGLSRGIYIVRIPGAAAVKIKVD
ncbi:MAG: chitobiase/beta-hexosaminidase C-terminal domain-containing protein, partial [Paramuribaculum sp.]|nr:chitobiase/beta-hexosaminidase C-terminal domain-containing protein [Paramuribaculum sp.]